MKKKKWLKNILIILPVLLISLLIIIKFQPSVKINFLKESNNPVSNLICSYPVKISGDSMSPILEPDQTYTFNKCFDQETIKKDTIILYNDNSTPRTGIIRYTQDYGRFVYKVSNERESQRIQDVLPKDISAVFITDISNTKYHEDKENIIVEEDKLFDTYMEYVYIGSLDKRLGIESGEVKQSSQIDLDTKKFCISFNPIKELQNTDFLIYDNMDNIIFEFSKGAILSQGQNINCISKGENNFNIEKGDYLLKIFVDNILIKTLPFEII